MVVLRAEILDALRRDFTAVERGDGPFRRTFAHGGGHIGKAHAPGQSGHPLQVLLALSAVTRGHVCVFVLNLDQDHRPAARGQMGIDLDGQPLKEFFHALQVRLVHGARGDARLVAQIRRKAAEVPLRAAIRPGAQKDLQPALAAEGEKVAQVAVACEVVDIARGFMEVPEDIRGNAVEAEFLAAVQQRRPHGARGAGVMHFAGNEQFALAVDQKRAAIEADSASGASARRDA